MPYINIKVTGGPEAPTVEQKNTLIRGVTELVAEVLNKDPSSTIVIIDEVPMDNWGLNGLNATERRRIKSNADKH